MKNKLALIVLFFASSLFATEPLTLSNAFELAIKNEPNLQASYFKIKANEESINQIKSKLYPQLQATSSLGRYEYEADYLKNKKIKEHYTDYSISATQAIYHPEYWKGVEQAKTKLESSNYKYKIQEQELGLNVAKAYFSISKENKNAELALSQKIFFDEKYRKLEEMLKVGLTNKIDVLETKTQRDKATYTLNISKKRNKIAKSKLELLIGQQINQIKFIDFTEIKTEKLILDKAKYEEKVEENPYIKEANKNVEIANNEITIRNYEHYPKIDLSLTRKQTNSSDPYTHIYDNQAIVKMTIPLYQGGYTQSRVKEGILLLSSAKKDQDFYNKDSRVKFEEIWEERTFNVENFNNLKESKASSELNLKSIEKAHSAGLKSIVDVLEARSKIFEISKDINEAGYEMISNHLSLLSLTGQLNFDNIVAYENLIY